VDLLLCAFRDRIAVADADDGGVERGEALQRRVMLRPVQVERVPTGTERRPRRRTVSRDEEPALGPPEREMAGRVAGAYSTSSGPNASPSLSSSSTGHATCFGRPSQSPSWNGISLSDWRGQMLTA
jgi:hypothetical protein